MNKALKVPIQSTMSSAAPQVLLNAARSSALAPSTSPVKESRDYPNEGLHKDIDDGKYKSAVALLRQQLDDGMSPSAMDTVKRYHLHTPVMYLAVRNLWKDRASKAVWDSAELMHACDAMMQFIMKVWSDVKTCTLVSASSDFSLVAECILRKVRAWVCSMMTLWSEEEWPQWTDMLKRLETASTEWAADCPAPYWVPRFRMAWNTLVFPDVDAKTKTTLATDTRVAKLRSNHFVVFMERAKESKSWVQFWTDLDRLY
jgi:hypothetical protein